MKNFEEECTDDRGKFRFHLYTRREEMRAVVQDLLKVFVRVRPEQFHE
jgi:hypothetical protein